LSELLSRPAFSVAAVGIPKAVASGHAFASVSVSDYEGDANRSEVCRDIFLTLYEDDVRHARLHPIAETRVARTEAANVQEA
jgi:hypothetical protein